MQRKVARFPKGNTPNWTAGRMCQSPRMGETLSLPKRHREFLTTQQASAYLFKGECADEVGDS